MSKLFNLSRILEGQAPDLVRQVSDKTYLSQGISLLRNYESSMNESTRTFYTALAEAEYIKEENDKFAEFFKEFRHIVNSFTLQAHDMAAQFAISIETFADANKDLGNLFNSGSVDILHPIHYKGVAYENLLSDEIPNIDPYKAFKSEFKMLGKLMQALDPVASDEQKASVISSVYNAIAKDIQEDWLKKCIKKITDCEDCKKDDFATIMYRKFAVELDKDMLLDLGTLKQAKLSLMNYTPYVNVIVNATTDLCDGMNRVADEIGSLFYRNQDHKFNLTCDDPDVENRTYRLNDYSFNQMNKFIATKITQMSELFNLYIIALSIKMDCIYKYMQQCKDMIQAVQMGGDITPDSDPGDEDVDNDGSPELDGSDDDIENDEPMSDEEIEPADDTMSVDDEDFDSEESFEPSDEEPPAEEVIDNSESDVEMECYLFEANIWRDERYLNNILLKQDIYNLVSEDSVSGGGVISQMGGNAKSGAGGVVGNIVRRITVLINKFIANFTKGNYANRFKFVNQNAELIRKANIPDNWTIVRLDVTPLLNIQLPKYNEKDANLNDTENGIAKFIEASFGSYMANATDEANSVKDRMLAKYKATNEDKYTNNDRNNGLAWCANGYIKAVNAVTAIRNQLTPYQNRENELRYQAQNASAVEDLEMTMFKYFTEEGEAGHITTMAHTNTSKVGSSTPKPQNSAAKPDQSAAKKTTTTRTKKTAADDNKPKDDASTTGLKKATADTLSTYVRAGSEVCTAMLNIFSVKSKKELMFLEKLAYMGGAKREQ